MEVLLHWELYVLRDFTRRHVQLGSLDCIQHSYESYSVFIHLFEVKIFERIRKSPDRNPMEFIRETTSFQSWRLPAPCRRRQEYPGIPESMINTEVFPNLNTLPMGCITVFWLLQVEKGTPKHKLFSRKHTLDFHLIDRLKRVTYDLGSFWYWLFCTKSRHHAIIYIQLIAREGTSKKIPRRRTR